MMSSPACLHFLCGKLAAGKSTLATKLADDPATVLIAEDDWLSALFADQLNSASDYLRCSSKLRAIMSAHISNLLSIGVSVVLDFPANTKDQRRWMTELIVLTKAPHTLHVLMPPDEVCLSRLRTRNASGTHPFAPTEAQFHQFAKHFAPPQPDEGFNIATYEDGI